MSLSIGQLELDESDNRAFEEEWSDNRKVAIAGTMHSPKTDYDRMKAIHDDVLNLSSKLVAVRFDKKDHRNGYYWVEDAKSTFTQLTDQKVILLSWEITLNRQGSANTVDIESRLSGPIARLNDHELGGERWHSPAADHSAYWSGTGQPSQVIRRAIDGPIIVYRNLDLGVNPRWYCPAEGYYAGAVSLLDPIAPRVGTDLNISEEWTLTNRLIEVNQGTDHTLIIGAYDGSTWKSKTYDILVNSLPLGLPLNAHLLRNDPHIVTLRMLYDQLPSGRYTVDLTLRRGSRFVEITIQSLFSSILGVVRGDAESAVESSGYVTAASNDADGYRYIVGSSKSFTGNLGTGGISLASTVKLDSFVGLIMDDTVGDQAEDLMLQYLGVPAEEVVAVKL